MTEHHRVDLFWSDEDGCWIANVPDLQFRSAHGDTPQAAAEIEIAMQAWLEEARERGSAIPETNRRETPSLAA